MLVGGAGNNTLDGGGGDATADYSAAPNGVSINLQSAKAANGYGGTDTLISVENVTGSAFNDLLIGDAGNNGCHVLWAVGWLGTHAASNDIDKRGGQAWVEQVEGV